MTNRRSRRRLVAPLLLLSAILFAGCISIEVNEEGFSSFNGDRGSGTLVTEHRAVVSFSSVELTGALKAEIAPGAPGIDVLFDDNLVDNLETTVRDGVLRLSCRECLPSSGSVIRLTASEIEDIKVSGASRLIATDVDVEQLSISVSGASHLEIDGDVDALDIDGSGASSIEGRNLVANRLEITLSGASSAEVTVVDRVQGNLSGASHLDLAGSERPSVDVNTSGGSSVRR